MMFMYVKINYSDSSISLLDIMAVDTFENRQYKYKTHPADNYSMILLGAAFIHLNLYFTNMNSDILDYVHKTANGEDITMNAIVADYMATKFTPQCSGIHISLKILTPLEKDTSMLFLQNYYIHVVIR